MMVGELAESVRANTSLKFGLYHSLYEWFNPMWMSDKENNQTTNEFVQYKILPEMYELVRGIFFSVPYSVILLLINVLFSR